MVRRLRRAVYATREQLVYAAALDVGMKIGFGVLVVTLLIYMSGLLDSHIPVQDLPRYWGLPAAEYIHAADVPTGWGWIGLAHSSDYLNFVGIAFLSGVTIVCYARILPYPFKSRDYLFVGMAAAQIVVLLLSASGILEVGH
ncbi:MAG: hypothetical protein FJX42_13415 [Alphaproteobacteria bacterium]|nr:hypothetical protein [Alphaproteobacteria bacterium]